MSETIYRYKAGRLTPSFVVPQTEVAHWMSTLRELCPRTHFFTVAAGQDPEKICG